jgi:NAD+ synthase
LYKTEVRALARHLEIPEQVITKPPSADLWTGQTDEGEIGVTYEQIDRLLVRLLDDGVRVRAGLGQDGLTAADLDRVLSLINQNAFKRQLPPIAPLGRAEVPNKITLNG